MEKTVALKEEWGDFDSNLRHVVKIGGVKFFECPESAIYRQTWEILELLNEITDESGQITHMIEPGTIQDQPPWIRQAAKILRQQRADHRREEANKRK